MLDLGQIRAGEVVCGHFRIERLLKAGGMGAVYVAEHTATRKKVALKLMRPEIVSNEAARARFAQEAQASGIIESANIVDVYDAGVDAATQVPFIAMELLTGSELGELIRDKGPLRPAEVADYIAQAARALDRAHAKGVIHRDLKPDNLFLSLREGEPPRIKILDFGIAKFLAGTGATETKAAGTPLYMAPEQSRKGSNIGPATDIWALGLIAYTLLVGRPYWDADDLHELFGEIFSGDYESPSARSARAGVPLPASFDAWFFRCVDADPERRFRRAGEAAAQLPEALGLAMDLPPPSRLPVDDALDEAPTRALSVRSLVSGPVGLSGASIQSGPDRTPPPAPSPIALAPGPVSSPHGTAFLSPDVAPAPASFAASPSAVASTTGPVVQSAVPAPAAAPGAQKSRLGLVLGIVAGVLVVAGGAALGVTRYVAHRTHAAMGISLGQSDATCTIHASGYVRCTGTRMDRKGSAKTPELLEFGAPVVELALGKHHGCARMVDGTVRCWGQNAAGQLGDGTTKPHAPADVPVLHGVTQVAAGIDSTCVLVASGRVRCWGSNKVGQVGDGSNLDKPSPVKVEGATGMTAVAMGAEHACALSDDGTVRCWGRNDEGQLGDGTTTDRPAPVPVAGLTDVAAIALGGHFSCALLRDGSVQCWGSNADGALGDGSKVASRPSPAPVMGITGATQVAAGWRHACVHMTSGALRCWGQNSSGQLGDGTNTARPIPVKASGTFTRLAAGRMHTCGIRDDGVTMCWGRNQEGQLGDGTNTDRSEPVAIKW